MKSRTTSMYPGEGAGGGKWHEFCLSIIKRMLSTNRGRICLSIGYGNEAPGTRPSVIHALESSCEIFVCSEIEILVKWILRMTPMRNVKDKSAMRSNGITQRHSPNWMLQERDNRLVGTKEWVKRRSKIKEWQVTTLLLQKKHKKQKRTQSFRLFELIPTSIFSLLSKKPPGVSWGSHGGLRRRKGTIVF